MIAQTKTSFQWCGDFWESAWGKAIIALLSMAIIGSVAWWVTLIVINDRYSQAHPNGHEHIERQIQDNRLSGLRAAGQIEQLTTGQARIEKKVDEGFAELKLLIRELDKEFTQYRNGAPRR